MTGHRHVAGGRCPVCADTLERIRRDLTAERFSGPVAPARFDPLSPADHAAIAARLTELAELPLEDGEPT